MLNSIDIKKFDYSFLGRECKHKGEFEFSGIVNISSNIEGDITVKNNGRMTIDYLGEVVGQINCFDLEIYGSFNGTIESKGNVTIQPSGRVKGSIRSKNLTIYPGATVDFEGHTEEDTVKNFKDNPSPL